MRLLERSSRIKTNVMIIISFGIPLFTGIFTDKIYLINSDFCGIGTIAGLIIGGSLLIIYYARTGRLQYPFFV